MKLKTIAITVLVTAGIIGGGGYGAYYAMQSQKEPVTVVPVVNVNAGGYFYYEDEDKLYGSVTSQVAQTINRNDEYKISEIYVKEGDSVKEGTPLFAYDMTLPELELEMEQLKLQTKEIALTKLEKDLDKLKKNPSSAYLEDNDVYDTAASLEEEIEEFGEVSEVAEEAEAADADEDTDAEEVIITDDSAEDEQNKSDGDALEEELILEEVQEVSEQEDAYDSSIELSENDGYACFESFMDNLKFVFEEVSESELTEEEIGYRVRLINQANIYFRKFFVDRIREEEQKIIISYKEDAELSEEQKGQLYEDYLTLKEYRAKLWDEMETVPKYSLTIWREEEKIYEKEVAPCEIITLDADQIEGLLPEAGTQIIDWEETESWSDEDRLLAYHPKDNMLPYTFAMPLRDVKINQLCTSVDIAESYTVKLYQGETELNSHSYKEGEEVTLTAPKLDGMVFTEWVKRSGDVSFKIDETDPSRLSFVMPAQNVDFELIYTRVYKVKILRDGNVTGEEEYFAEEKVTFMAPELEGYIFSHWEAESNDLLLKVDDDDERKISFTMPSNDVVLKQIYIQEPELPDVIQGNIDAFAGLYAKAEEVKNQFSSDFTATERQEYFNNYSLLLEDAVLYYQQWLAEVNDEIQSETDDGVLMEMFTLRNDVAEYLNAQGGEQSGQAEVLAQQYKTLCLDYVMALFQKIDAVAPEMTDVENAQYAYYHLGNTWVELLEKMWKESQELDGATSENGNATENGGNSENENSSVNGNATENGNVPGKVFGTISDYLKVYRVLAMFQEYLKLDEKEQAKERLVAAQKILDEYEKLTDTQRILIAQNEKFADFLMQNGYFSTADELETEMNNSDFYGFDDFDGFDDEMSASDIKELIESKENQIERCKLEIRELKLHVDQKQRIVDGKIVKSKLEGTVVVMGSLDGASHEDYFAKIVNESGLYARAAMSELDLEKIRVGDTISGMMTETGVSFTAEIKEISDYPNASEDSYGFFSTGNSNASYYPFYARLDNTEDIEEGEAEITLAAEIADNQNVIYLENYLVRNGKDGKNYVYVQGADGLLEKRNVITGKRMYSYAIEIVSGLSNDDKIAFPYGKNVKAGAQTREADSFDEEV